MAGLAPISLQQRISPNGRPYVGAKAYFYDAETLTPIDVWSNNDLSVALSNPVISDGYGMFPAIYLDAALGFYRIRVTTSTGTILTDLITLPIYDQPDGGGGATTPVDADAVLRTGDVKWRYGTGSHSGFVRANGRTIGSATSGGTERANLDCESLFEYLWTVNSYLTVSGGRGASAAADWSANKTIALPDMRGRAQVGLDDMGSSRANTLTDTYVSYGDGTTLGSFGGSDSHTLTSGQTPSHTHSFSGTTSSDGAHSHTTLSVAAAAAGSAAALLGNSISGAISTSTDGAHTHTFSGTTGSSGSGQAHNNMSPFVLGTFYMKL